MRHTRCATLWTAALAATLGLPAVATQAQPSAGPPPEAVARFCVEALGQATEFVRERIADTAKRTIRVLNRMDEGDAEEEALKRFAAQSKESIRRFGKHAAEVFERFASQCLEFLAAAGAPDALLDAVEQARDDAIASVRRIVERACNAIEGALDEILMDRLDGGLDGEDPALAA